MLWAALAHNERRVALFGFDTNRLKAVAFGTSGLLAGIGGALYAPQQGLVTPQLCGFALSADLVIWAAVGGRGRLLGPMLGAIVVGALTSALRDRFRFWEIAIAIVFILVVLLFPQGLAGVVAPLGRLFARRRRALAPLAAPARAEGAAAAQLVVDGVDVTLGEVAVLNGLSLRVDRPGIHCMIGPNGAGKTSTFNLLTGELAARSGQVRFDGHALDRLPTHRIARLGIGRKFQIPAVFPALTIADNLAIALWSGRARALDLLRPRLARWTSPVLAALQERYPFLAGSDRTAAELSHGERQILELAMALLGEPRLLLLDEPCAGLSPQETATVIELIRWASTRHERDDRRHRARHEPRSRAGRARLRPAQRQPARRRQRRRGPGRSGGTGDLRGGREMSAPAAAERDGAGRAGERDGAGRAGAAPARLAFDGLSGGYGGADVVRGVSGDVAAGEVLGVIGRNGVGKSTLMKMLFGEIACRAGRIAFEGEPIERLEASLRRALGISYCPQERPVFDDLSVRDNLTLMRGDRGLAPFEPLFARFPILPRRLGQHAGTLSGGEKKILSFVRGLSETQPLVLLDEPSEGVQWENIVHMAELIGQAKAAGTAFVVVEQNLAFAELIADRYLVIDQGRVVLAGTRAAIGRERLLAHLQV